MKKLAAAVLSTSLFFGVSSGVMAKENPEYGVGSYIYSVEATEALNHINKIRKSTGLSEVKLNPFITKAAENHATYLDSNKKTGHNEVSGLKGFTGVTHVDRMSAVGTPSDLLKWTSEGIGYRYSSPSLAIDEFMDTAYHRLPLIMPTVTDIGVGMVGKTFVINYAGYEDSSDISMYPYDGQRNVPVSFEGAENPNPLKQFGVTKTGFPISFYDPEHYAEEMSVDIKNSKGGSVPCFIENPDEFWIMYPKKVLSAGETYTVTVSYYPAYGEEKDTLFTKSWSFTTAESTSKPTNPTTPTSPDTSKKYTIDNVGVSINGSMVALNPTAEVFSGNTFIPLRGVFEKMDSQVKWEQKAKTVTVTRNGVTVKLTIGSKKAYVNGETRILPVAPHVTSGTTYVPLRFVSETIGAKVNWDQSKYIVSITTS